MSAEGHPGRRREGGGADRRPCLLGEAKLVDDFLSHVPFKVAAEYCGAAEFIALDDVRPLEFLLYLYFGKTEEDL